MQQVTTEGKEVRYWDFTAQVKVKAEDGSEKTISGDFVKKPVTVSFQAPENSDEVFAVSGNDEKRLVELVTKGLEAEAADKAGEIPDGTWSPAMVSAATKALKLSPQFSGLKHSELRDSVMRFIGSNEAMKAGFTLGLAGLKKSQSADEE